MKQTIAIIGGGIAGLTAGYLLREKYEITLFEKSGRIGGNAYTLTTGGGEEVDIAAAAFGRFSYRNLFRLFKHLNIETVEPFSPLSLNPFKARGLGVSFYNLETKKGIYLTPGMDGLLSQKFAILRPDYIAGVLQLMRGLKKAGDLLQRGELQGLTVEEAFKRLPALTGSAKLIFVGCLCLISSMHCGDVLDAPAGFLIEKLKKYHDLMPPKALLSVCFTKNRTKRYVDALAAPFWNRIMFNSNIRTVLRRNNKVIILRDDGKEMLFDKVVFACNADQALRLLGAPADQEKRLLGAWKYTEGKVVVHTDGSQFPKKELMEGYTFLYRNKGRYMETSVSGSLWALPGVSRECGLISTQHPNFPVQKNKVVFETVFRTPIFDYRSCPTIQDLPSLNGINNTYYCGSHFGFGLHEDAVTSAIEVASKLGVDFK